MSTKHCPGAGEQGPHEELLELFAQDRSRRDGKAPYCRVCAATKQREWKAKHPDRVRAAKQKYRQRATAVELA